MLAKPRHLFVYGTLMRGSRSPYAQLLQRRAFFVGEATALGRLYHLGRFPGAVFEGQRCRKIYGEIFRLKVAALLDALDAYEACRPEDPEPHLFRREIVEVQLKNGSRLSAWSYAFIGKMAGRPEIRSGRFFPR
ncbi:MAG: gamma-glutamylcyclotransferase family protein [Rhodomicrobium sp.]